MPKYNVEKAIWLGGLLQAAGSVVTLTESQAKYWGHALSKVEDQPAAVAAPVAKKAAKKTEAAGPVVTEQSEAPADGAGN
jgi:hypothetical protein